MEVSTLSEPDVRAFPVMTIALVLVAVLQFHVCVNKVLSMVLEARAAIIEESGILLGILVVATTPLIVEVKIPVEVA